MNAKIRRYPALFLAVILFFGPAAPPVSAAVKPRVTKKLALTAGKTGKIRVRGKYVKSVKYKSRKKKVATVTGKGKVKAKKAGICKIRVTVKYKKKKKAKKVFTKKYICRVVVSKKQKTTPAPTYSPSSEFTKQTVDFSVKLMQNSAAKQVSEGKNVLLSPESVICALAMTASGAGGNTLAEFEKVLCGGINRADFNQTLHTLNANLTASRDVKFHLANSIWLKEGLDVKEDFILSSRALFQADVKEVPFDKDTLKQMNDWVKKSTGGMIDKILDQMPNRMVMALLNAISFEGNWEKQYREYNVHGNQAFTDARGNKDKATMLYGTEHNYLEDDKATGFVKYYEGGDYAFVAIRPKDGVSAYEYLSGLDGEKFLELYKGAVNGAYETVYTRMPEFSYDYSSNLNEPLMAMGIQEAFSPERADFKNMAEVPGANIYISDVLHKTHIELDRNGTKAAAVTAVIAKASSALPVNPPKEVYLDKPFLYAIVEAKTGFPIFMGVLNDLS